MSPACPCLRRPFLCLLFALVFVVALVRGVSAQTPISGQAVPSLSQLDTIMQQYMTQYSSPGANLSVSVDGRLVFARGYGYANTATGEFVQPDSRMRIASNSKPITASGILKLIEQGKLTLATQPFVTILNDLKPPAGTTMDPRVLNITIQELLQHKAGYDDTGSDPDPTFAYIDAAADAYGTTPPATPAELISYMLGKPLEHDPGTTYAYSNLGYLTLGYIIERVTGVPYATWIEQNIFPIAGMTQTLPGASLEAGKLPYEVHYYDYPGAPLYPSNLPPVGALVPFPYGGYSYELALANGGWTSTPMDLLRFWDSLNGQFPTNILNGPQGTRIGDIPPVGQGYYYTFYGSLPGTNSLVHLNTSSQVVGRVVYSAIFNTRDGNNLEEPESDADNAIQAFVQTVRAWPSGNLFPTYAGSGTACSFTLASATATAPMAGSTGTDVLTDANYCAWSAVSNATWIHVTAGALNSDTGTVGYTVDANSGAARTGTIAIAGQTLTITQGGTATATTLTLTGSATYVGTTETVNLKATLAPYSATGATTDGETIVFQDGGNQPALGTAMLSGGVATLTTTVTYNPALQFTASYAGDTTFGASYTSGLTLTPTGSSATVAPASLTFPSTPMGSVSAPQTSTFTNTGTTAISLDLLAVSGQFKQTNNCGGSVAVGASCVFTVTFNPTSTGPLKGQIVLDDSAGEQTINLTGTGVAAAPIVSFAPASLVFAGTQINTTGAAQSSVLTNTGNAPLTITGIAASAGFTETNNCPASLAANAMCTIMVASAPTAVGPYTGTVTVSGNVTGTIALSGTGTAGPAPAATLAPMSLAFPATQVATTSAALSATLTNSGTAALTISGIAASAGFAETNNCPASLGVGASCTISVTSTPAAVGAYTGSISVTDNATGSPQVVALSGTGAAYSAPTITLTGSPATATYGQAVMLSAVATGAQAAGGYTWSVLDGATVVTSGVAYTATFNYTIATPTAGTHSYTAVLVSSNAGTYPNGTSNAFAVTIAKAATTSTYTMPAAITYGTALGAGQLTATSTTAGTFAYTPPAGTVLAVGTQTITATLTPTDATDYSGSTASTTVVVNKAALTATAASATRAYGAANPAFTGTLTGVVNGDAITATYSSTAAATAAAGTTAPIAVTLVDPAGRLVNYNATTTPGVLTIVQAGSTLTLTGPATVLAGATATLTATAASTTSGTPTGMVTFTAGGATVGTAMLTGGVATLTYTPANGASTITAVYGGDTNFTASTSNGITLVSGLPDFAVTATPSTATIKAGGSGTFTLTASPINGYNQTVTFACAGLPAHATCTFAPSQVTPAGAPASTQLVIATSVVGTQAAAAAVPMFGRGMAGTFLASLLMLPWLRRRKSLRGAVWTMLLLAGIGGALTTATGCGGGSVIGGLTATPAGTYTVMVSGNSYGTARTTALTVTVN